MLIAFCVERTKGEFAFAGLQEIQIDQVVRVQGLVAKELEQRPMQVVRSRLGDDIYICAGVVPERRIGLVHA